MTKGTEEERAAEGTQERERAESGAHEEGERKEGKRELLKDNSIPVNSEILSSIEMLDGLFDSFSNEGFYRSWCSLEQESLSGQRPHLYST